MSASCQQITMDEYLSLKVVSSGMLHRLLAQSPLHAWFDSPFNPDRARRDSKEMDIGSYAHACLLEGSCDKLVTIDAPDWRTKDARTARDSARTEGKLPILKHKLSEVNAMVDQAHAFIGRSEIAGVFDNGAAEQTILFDEFGVECKARPDWLKADGSICLSYKTTAGSANPGAWIRTQLPSYDLATVFYEAAVLAVYPEASARVIHLVQEQSAPFACSLVDLAPPYADLSRRKLEMALGIWRECAERKKWDAYPGRVASADVRDWQEAEVMQREVTRLMEIDPLQAAMGLQA